MSHITTAKICCTSATAVTDAMKQLGATCLGQGLHKLWTRQVQGQGWKLPSFRWPVVIDANGLPHYDLYEGQWGTQEKIDEFLQAYGVTAAKEIAQSMSMTIESQETLPDGSIKLVLGGGAEAGGDVKLSDGGAPSV